MQEGGFASSGHLAGGYWEGGSFVSAIRFGYVQSRELIEYAFPGNIFALLFYLGAVVLIVRRKAGEILLIGLPFAVTLAAALFRFYPYIGWRQNHFLTPLIYLVAAIGFDYVLRMDTRRILFLVLLIFFIRKVITPIRDFYQEDWHTGVGRVIHTLAGMVREEEPIYICTREDPVIQYYFSVYYPDLYDNLVERNLGSEPRDYLDQVNNIVNAADGLWMVLDHNCGDLTPFVEHISERCETELIEERYLARLYRADKP